MATKTFHVRDGYEYGEFFVDEREPKPRAGGGFDYAATWCCYSSFGVFGHHWSSMGESFAEFIAEIDEGYLLGKIAQKEFNDKVCINSIWREIREARRNRSISKDAAREGFNAFNEIVGNYDGPGLATMLYESSELHACNIEWCDVSTTDFAHQAVMFCRKLWPKFVAAVNETAQKGAA